MRALALLAVAVALLAGCSTTPAVTLQSVGQPPSGPSGPVSTGLDSVPVGIVLGFRVTANSSAVVTEAIDDPSVATVAPTTQTAEFVVIGEAIGQTTLHVFVDNREAMELPVQVTASAP
jgi:putative type II/III system pilus formation protein